MTSKIHSLQSAQSLVSRWKDAGYDIAFTNGCFDILHIGHIRCLQSARQLADKLIVGLNSDASVKRLKGESRPIHTENHRAELLAALTCVDMVVIFEEDTPAELIAALGPDILAKGGDYTADQIAGSDSVLAAGGKVVIIPFVEGFSTTSIINKS